MAQYRVKPGVTFGWDDRYGPGDVLELSEAEARGFLDKLEPVEAEPEGDEPTGEDEPTAQSGKKRKG